MSSEACAAPASPTSGQLGRRALSLGAAGAFDYAVQLLVPVVLVRCLDASEFGEYRLLWLIVGTVMALAPLAMPGSLNYFLPRSDGATRRLYINQALLFLAASGLVSGWAVSAWNPWLPDEARALIARHAPVPAFIALWVVAALLDALPAVDERTSWQARTTILLSTLRGAALCLAAFLTRELEYVLLALLTFVVLKIAVLLHYIARNHGLRAPFFRWGAFAEQVKFAAPLGFAGALYGLRVQADQWVAAALFPLGMFAAFSIGAVLAPIVQLFRRSVNFSFMPSMSRLEAARDVAGMLRLNGEANVMVANLVCPLFAFAFVFAEELVTLVYTETYVAAAPVMRVYIIGLAALVVDLSTITLLLRQAPFVMGVNLAALCVAMPLNWQLAQQLGLAGAAMGGVATIYLDRAVTLWRIARCAGVPVRRLQDWGALARPFLFSALAAALAWALAGRHSASLDPFLSAAAGGIFLMAAYGMLQALFRALERSGR